MGGGFSVGTAVGPGGGNGRAASSAGGPLLVNNIEVVYHDVIQVLRAV